MYRIIGNQDVAIRYPRVPGFGIMTLRVAATDHRRSGAQRNHSLSRPVREGRTGTRVPGSQDGGVRDESVEEDPQGDVA